MIKEACVDTLQEAILAEQKGAHQLELCADLSQDGLTPADGLIAAVLSSVQIPVKIMIRPRAGDFCYTPTEIASMKQSILAWKKKGVQGFVFGVLKADHTIDSILTSILAETAAPLSVTFHKAIDQTQDLLEAVLVLKGIPEVTHILSSGGHPTANEGKEVLKKMMELAEGHPAIIPAGKITTDNLMALHRQLNAQEYHGRRIVW